MYTAIATDYMHQVEVLATGLNADICSSPWHLELIFRGLRHFGVLLYMLPINAETN